jgi:uncharacterized protein YebE (UPF0316 family)
MTWDIFMGCLVIFVGRVADVTLGSLRTVAVVSGQRGLAWLFGFVEVMIWVFVVASVVAHVRTEPAYAIAFALGAASGNYVGVTVLRWLPFGHQVVRIFTRESAALLGELRSKNLGVTEFCGTGRDGPVSMLFVHVRRDRAPMVVRAARKVDPQCFYTIDDIRTANAHVTNAVPTSAQL